MAGVGRRRRRTQGPCPNALFVRWVEEWRDEAREKGVKTQYTYAKAAESLKKYPLPLQSGQEARILSHIGEKLAQKLDEKLEEYRNSVRDNSDVGSGSAGPSDLYNSRLVGPASSTEGVNSHSETPGGSDFSAKKRRKASEEYIPAYRSGPYALLVALHNAAEQRPGFPGYLSRLELQSEAQKYCDTSFTIPNAGSYYTAWSSMSSLTRRGLISKVGNPARYILTEAGAVLAAKLLEGSAALTDKPVQVPTAPASLREDETASSDDDSASSPEISPPRASIELMSSQSGKSELCFWYVTPEEKCVCRKDQAAVTFNDKLTVGFLVRCSKKLLESSSILYTLDHHRKQVDGMVFAYIANEDAPEIATPPSEDMEGQGELGKRPKGHVRVDSDDSSDVEEVLPLSERLGLSCAHPLKQHTDIPLACKNVPSVRKDITPVHKDVVSVQKDAPTVHKDAPTVQKDAPTVHKDAPTVHKDAPTVHKDAPTVHKDSASVHSTVTSNTIDKTSPSRTNQTYMFESSWTPTERAGLAAIRRNAHDGLTSKMPEVSSHTATTSPSISGMATTSVASSSMSEAMVDLSNPVCVLRPGQFEVVLCVDSSESSSNRRSASQFRGMLLQELGKNGIRFDVRRLNVGDFMWIAKEMVLPQPGQLSLPQSTEIVLEHIVERKRMDDLAFSICDGRFHEQKFRLKQCGVKYPVYLVEDYGSHTHLQLDARALEQAITNTQVIDKFFVKRTKDLRGSVEYLTLLTRYLQKYYVGKTLKAYPLDTVLLQNKCEKPSDPTVLYSTLFEEFNTASLKNKVLTTYEMFAMHLIPLAGVSAEKAHAILEVFPTVASLRHAYKQCLSEKERENLISDIRAGQGQRRVGPAISRLIYTLYWKS